MSSSTAPSALWYLWIRSARNRVRAQKSRLKQPRNLVAIALGALYLYWIVSMNGREDESPFGAILGSSAAPVVASALLLLTAARWWLMKPDRSALAFTPAEVHLLFPAPVTRQALLQSKLLRSQFAILLNVLIWVVLLRGDASSVHGWQRGVALWMLFSAFTLHRLGAALVRINAQQNRAAGVRRAALPVLIFGAMFATIAAALWRARPAITAAWADGFTAVFDIVAAALNGPMTRIALAPVKALIAPVFATSSGAWLGTLAPALLVLALHYLWVLRTDAAFEEAALEASQERAKKIEALSGKSVSAKRSKGGSVNRVFPLPQIGHPAVAIAWKNSAAAIRSGGWLRQQLLLCGIFAATLITLHVTVGVPFDAVLAMTAIWGLMLLLIGPIWTRYDLRLDLRDLGLLRTLPLSGRAIVTAEIIGVSLLHTLSILSFLLVPVLLAFFDSGTRTAMLNLIGAPIPTAIGTVLVVVCIALLTFTVQNGLALLYPAWVQLGTDRRGFEAMGQTMLTTGIMAISCAVALVFPLAVAAAAGLAARVWLGSWAIPIAGLAALAVVLAELIPLWIALGTVFDQTEPGDVPGQRS